MLDGVFERDPFSQGLYGLGQVLLFNQQRGEAEMADGHIGPLVQEAAVVVDS